jgi:hypothetical protein
LITSSSTARELVRSVIMRSMAYLAGQPDVWLTTSDEISAHYRRAIGIAAS